MYSDLLFYLKDHNFIGYYQYIVFTTDLAGKERRESLNV